MPNRDDVEFEGDAFISYAHLDNVELVPGHQGWIANLHRALEIRVAQLVGKESRIWWDPKLQGNDAFADTLMNRLKRVATLISVVSPRYVRSDWARRELAAFCQAAQAQGGIRVGDKARLFKVLKTPVPLEEHPPELQGYLGYEFFKVDPETGRVREFCDLFGPEAERDFWIKLDDLAHDVCDLLEILEPGADAGPPAAPGDRPVFLALTTSDLKEPREIIKRDLEQHGHTVLPDRPLPITAAEVEAAVRQDLARCRMSIHMIGRTFSLVPEGGSKSLLEIQNDLAAERAATGPFPRLLWIPPGLAPDDERQRRFVEQLWMDPRVTPGTDVLGTPLEELRTMIAARLEEPDAPTAAKAITLAPDAPQLYFIYPQQDAAAVAPWADLLFKQCEIIQPVFDGDEAELREYHEENLRSCDGALIFYGAANEAWLRRKLRELQKAAGYGRTKAEPIVGICLIAPKTPEKERFRTHDAIVVPQWDGVSADLLTPFVSCLAEQARARQGDGPTPV